MAPADINLQPYTGSRSAHCKKQERANDTAASLEPEQSELRLSTTVVEELTLCIIIDVSVAGQQARAVIDTGACFSVRL
jgi:hypothetical protein